MNLALLERHRIHDAFWRAGSGGGSSTNSRFRYAHIERAGGHSRRETAPLDLGSNPLSDESRPAFGATHHSRCLAIRAQTLADLRGDAHSAAAFPFVVQMKDCAPPARPRVLRGFPIVRRAPPPRTMDAGTSANEVASRAEHVTASTTLTLAKLRVWIRGLRPANYLQVVRWLPRASRPLTALAGVLVLVTALLPVAFIVVSGALVGAMPEVLAGGGLNSPAGERFSTLLFVLGVVLVAQQVSGPVMELVSSVLADRVTLNASADVMRQCSAPASISHLENPATLNNISLARGVGSLGWGPGTAARAAIQLTSRKLGAIGSVAVIARYNLFLAGVIVVIWLSLRRNVRAFLLRTMQAQIGNVEAHRRATYFRGLSFGSQAAKETRLFHIGPWIRDGFTRHWGVALEQLRAARKGGLAELLRFALLFGATEVGALLILLRAALRGDISLGEFTAYAQAVLASGLLVAGYLPEDSQLEFASASLPAAESLRQLGRAASSEGNRPVDPDMPVGSITFEGVSFAYPGTDRPVFKGLDLEIPAGRSLAIVGLNGAGKTTLIKLLARLYDPDEGAVRVDGLDLREFDPRQWQRKVGAIFQDFVRYELSARHNVGFGAHERMNDEGALTEAVRRARADTVIESLPAGWETILARGYSGGHELSGGQWQKVALARALMAVEGGARILVLDEPTANLDVRSEAELFEQFLDVTAGVTTLLVSHRFSTVRHVDEVCVIEGGRLVERGSHDRLVEAGGRYAELFRLQASRFEDHDPATVEAL